MKAQGSGRVAFNVSFIMERSMNLSRVTTALKWPVFLLCAAGIAAALAGLSASSGPWWIPVACGVVLLAQAVAGLTAPAVAKGAGGRPVKEITWLASLSVVVNVLWSQLGWGQGILDSGRRRMFEIALRVLLVGCFVAAAWLSSKISRRFR